MFSTLLVIAFVAEIQVSLLLVVVMLRAQKLTIARGALVVYLLGTATWSAIEIAWELSRDRNVGDTQAWVVVVVAVVVAAARVSARALANPRWHPNSRDYVNLAIHPVAMLVIALVPAWHGFLVTVGASGESSFAMGFWIHVAVSYALLVSAGIRFIRVRGGISALSSYSTLHVFLPWSVPFIAGGITVVHSGPGGPELTPLAFLFTAAVIGRAVVKDGLAGVVPIARVHVFESFTDAIFVVDSEWRLVDANARALRLLGESRPAVEIASTKLAELSADVARICRVNGEHDIEVAGNKLIVGVSQSPLVDARGRSVGALIHVRDITVDVLQRRELVEASVALAREAMVNEELRAELAEQVVRDAGTGLRNRRFALEALPDMAVNCDREGVPLSVVMLDLDDFKAVNDTYGHAVGDRALGVIGSAMEEAAEGSVVTRFGGEEFLVLMPGVSARDAVDRAEAIRAACSSVEIPTREGAITITVSAGVATSEPGRIDTAALIDAADGALYDAKAGGRNRVCSVATSIT